MFRSISSSMAATPGEVAKAMAAVGGATAAAGAWLAMALVRLVTTAVSAAICCANSAFEGVLPAMFGLGILDCLGLGGMVGICLFCSVHGLAWLTCLVLTSLTSVGCN